MRHDTGVLLITCFVAVFGLLLATGPFMPVGSVLARQCIDYDDANPDIASFIFGVDNAGRLFSSPDACVDATHVREFYCEGSLPMQMEIECQAGTACFEGACSPVIEEASVFGSGVQVGSPTDLLEINEPIGSVRETLTEFDLDFLRGGSISTRRGVTKYNQYLKFDPSATTGAATFDEDEFDNVGVFFQWTDGARLFDYVLEFEEGLQSDVEGGQLEALLDRNINILGTQYAITGASISGNSFTLELLGGGTMDLGELDEVTFIKDGKAYNVKVLIVSETSNEVLLQVNGETLPKLRIGESHQLHDGLLIGIRDIIPTAKETQSSLVRIFTSASKIRLTDNDVTDDSFTVAGATINNEVIEDASVKIKLSMSGDRAVLNSITYRLFADGILGDINVPAGHGLREYLDEPEGMLSPNWDIHFEGLLETGVSTIRLRAVGRDEYKLEFTNQEGLAYVIPFISARQGNGLRFGDFTGSVQRNLVFIEGASSADFKVRPQDFIVVSNIDGSSDNTAFTHVLKYDGFDSTNSVLTFTDLATGIKQVSLSGGSGSLIVGGISYEVFVDSAGSLAVDLNGDGGISGDTAVIATAGGALLTLGTSNPAAGGVVGATNNLKITTLARQFDEAASDETITINIEFRSGNQIGINKISGITLSTLTINPQVRQGLDDYGSFYELFDPRDDQPEELTIEYPLSQRGANLVIG